ncbi:MAG: DUF177 domain-containing protein [Roseomonas sp.]|nr:DUF177 domain-containing protein [Roseomonas sp.]MCA3328065.1 DUF177 domain-containing protein [Roseomonas sp.]MCA3332842.1 DUF177 domain-containing protein [Roseomonas sp.]MCA3336638.1 DUF177 domain-containing protein [Roseomonas sp.]MCA3347087.1 DUF177 domain-containing protein [Roseomonas sp.]
MLPEFSRRQILTDPPQAGVEDHLEASPAECAALAQRFGIEALKRFSARFTRKPYPGGGLLITGRLKAEPVQLCVVSLEPVTEQLDKPFTLVVLPADGALSEDPDGPDEIQADATGHFDLGEALAEELSLSLNPYPRAAGAHLPLAQGEAAEATPRNPFAALAALRGAKG